MINIASPSIGKEEVIAVEKVLKSGMLAQGQNVKTFEERIAEYTGVNYAIATSSGTTALHTALIAIGIRPGDEVITTPFTFIATANSILYCGAKPVFVDVDERTFNIDPTKIEEKITEKTKAILPVHLFGQPADIESLLEICESHNLLLIEDAAQAIGAEFKGKKVGSFGVCGIFSFYPTKNITTGEGGMITTNDEKIAERCRKIRNHGEYQRYFVDCLGYNYRMTEIAAAIGLIQFKKLESLNSKRIKNAKFLTKKLKFVEGLEVPFVAKNVKHVYHQYTIKTNKRNKLKDFLDKKGIQTVVYYPLPIHKQPLYQQLGYKDFLPVAEQLSNKVLSLPVHPALTKKDLQFIVDSIKEFFEGKR
ncbi:MAG: DegT/DnrJ/EryC1/StrS family aminotransferase [Candidatus Aenigmatarchaeota archaeon]